MRAWRALAFVACCLAATPMRSEERLLVEETFLAVDIRGHLYNLEALVLREAGSPGRLPVALITHGQAPDPGERERVSARAFLRTAREFARRGWLAAVVVRRGFGRSEGRQFYALRGCRDGDYAPMLDEQTDDVEAALVSLRRRRDADPERMIALGVSTGGAVVLNLAARRPEGLRAVINVSGGVRTRAPEGGSAACKPEDLISLFARLGERGRLPSLWLYAENDSFFPGDYVRQLHEAYVAKGGRTEFHMFEAIGEDGHSMFRQAEGMLRWIPALDRFLRAQALPTHDPSAVDALLRGLKLSPSGRQVAMRYWGRPTEKVMAASQTNKTIYVQFGGDDLDEVEAKARQVCEERAKEPCRILLRNFEVVSGAE